MEYYTAIGIDVSDRTSKICVMTKIGGSRRIVEETTVATTKEGFSEYLVGKSRDWPVTFETGVHCRWMASHIRSMGFKVYVANPAKLKGLRIAGKKSANSRKRAITAIARGLAVAMMALLKHPEREYKPLSECNQQLLERISAEQAVQAA